MKKIKVYAFSTAPHTAQIYTGLYDLSVSGEIKPTYLYHPQGGEFGLGGGKGSRNFYVMFIENDAGDLIYFDMNDGKRIDIEALKLCKVYFKRSYRPNEGPEELRHKIFPWGLHYEVHPDGIDVSAIVRALKFGGFSKQTALEFARMAGKITRIDLPFTPRIGSMQAKALARNEPRVLFSVRAWDPEETWSGRKLDDIDISDRIAINSAREKCIRRLKTTLGDRFVGGFYHNDFARANYPDLLLPNRGDSSKGSYIQTLKGCDICVATTGLHDSIGWKLAEYVAFSKAIVSEPLMFEPSGDFREGVNYSSFRTSEDCYEKVMELVDNRTLRDEMMLANERYYRTWLTPSGMVRRAISISEMLPANFTPSDRIDAFGRSGLRDW